MILILASIADTHAVAFAGEFPRPASVLTCNDLVRGPSRLFHPRFSDSTITVAGRTVRIGEISAVLNLLPAVLPNELAAYPPEERTYQAAEFRALLVYFLASLPCPVVNRASTVSLTGTVQNPAAWFAVAEAAGIPLAHFKASSQNKGLANGNGPVVRAAIVGGRIVERSRTVADGYTLELARRSRVEYLRAVYRCEPSGVRFLGADSYPDIRQPQTRAALRDYLLEVAA